MPTSREPISFEVFGKNFMDRVLTAQRVADSIEALVQKVNRADLHGTKTIDGNEVRFIAVPDKPRVERNALPSAFQFTITLPMAVSIEILAIPDKPNYTLNVEATLVVTAMTCSPLLIVLAPQPVTPASVRVKVSDKDEGLITWLAGLFKGNIEEKVTGGVQQTIADILSKAIAGAGDALTIDIEAKVAQSLGGGAGSTSDAGKTQGSSPKGKPGGPTPEQATAIAATDSIAGELDKDGWSFYSFEATAGKNVRLTLYFQGPNTIYSYAIADSFGGVLRTNQRTVSLRGFDYQRDDLEWEVTEDGTYLFRITADDPLVYRGKFTLK